MGGLIAASHSLELEDLTKLVVIIQNGLEY
jgi:hypothetical protein